MDQKTITAAQHGDRQAQARLLTSLQDVWYRFCLAQLRDAEQAADATQETALRFLRQLPGFRGQSELKTWSIGIALNVAREIRRKHPDAPLPEEEPPNAADEPAVDLEKQEQQDQLRAVLGELSQRQREVVVLRFFEDLSTEQTAIAMQCAAGTVKATLHQALRILRNRLTASQPPPAPDVRNQRP